MSKEVEELSVSDCCNLDSLLADRNFVAFKRQVVSLKNDGKDVRKYEKRLEGLEPAPTKQLTGVELWQYLERKHGYRSNA